MIYIKTNDLMKNNNSIALNPNIYCTFIVQIQDL